MDNKIKGKQNEKKIEETLITIILKTGMQKMDRHLNWVIYT